MILSSSGEQEKSIPTLRFPLTTASHHFGGLHSDCGKGGLWDDLNYILAFLDDSSLSMVDSERVLSARGERLAKAVGVFVMSVGRHETQVSEVHFMIA